ncbi:MAG: putative sulfate exporter family transporter [Candidatus Omnitrophica bacterium]|nr:putative sulfate exporter family transporter [Candidatus Omnitrophota bacterium]
MQPPKIYGVSIWLVVTLAISLFVFLIGKLIPSPLLDPLLVALTLGIILRLLIKFNDTSLAQLRMAPAFLIPPGVILYGAVNLNFSKLTPLDPNFIFLIFIVFLIYTISCLMFSRLLRLNERTGYLITTGSTICGASAITITSRGIDAEPEEISLSLIPIFIAALIGLFFIMPNVKIMMGLSPTEYGVFAGTVLQFTGFVKAAVADLPGEVQNIAMSVKAVRYVGLLFMIPLFASIIKGKPYVPMVLWFFLGAGLLFSFFPTLTAAVKPFFKTLLNILWSMAMAAIGLNANAKKIFSREGLKALIVSLLSFFIATSVFLTGILILK